ncbi:selenium metabolism-associated LysR family transcriptional regulator [Isachenkonia alkalipeptolytica]|uniref:LysR family transcriptional regulator n=1 Tax=Isachenkonia alkalipeptolytica TaxID=2565777 RepID=A0AA43XIG4_9CLOT|nr:selenium metabolism-associated LysR family transcriptional regulator [Isachenkonia alkalipeptolytica]NBG87408.1 LysR family transcriptional regulator [Isachenkonia alkalipeptolytica]
MDIKQLETFIAIAKHKSFSKAAESLFLTQPTVSNHIANLEKELDTNLINRSNRKISLTPSGEILYDYARSIISLKKDASLELSKFQGKMIGHIEIASSTIPEQYLLPEILYGFHREYPEITYNLAHFDSKEVVEGILKGSIDFGFVGAKSFHKQLEYLQLVEDEILLVTPNTEPFTSWPEEINLETALEHPYIFREEGSGSRKLVEEALQKQDIQLTSLHTVAYIENTEAIKQCVRRGLGLSFLSKYAITDELRYGLLKAIRIKEVNLFRHFYFVYHKNRTSSPLDREFQQFIKAHFRLS